MARVAVVLFNLGGPDSLAAVRPFLVNLFSDPAIIAVAAPFRLWLARLIAQRREAAARDIYGRIGGKSPLLEQTRAQAQALETALGRDFRAFVAMRYWHPMTEACAAEVKAWRPERIVLLPLYPQFSTTTTQSSFAAWRAAAARIGLAAPTAEIRDYPTEPGMIAAQAELIAPMLDRAGAGARLLFSAHGLPLRTVTRGDPYPRQVEATAAAVAAALGRPGLDWRVCYQSRVGPLEWLGPYTDAEIRAAGAEKKPLVVAPIAFVSEHSETLVELDMDYARLARESGVPRYLRVPALGTNAKFIEGLAALARAAAH